MDYLRHVPTQDDPFDVRVKAFLNDNSEGLTPEDRLTAEDIKAAALLAEREDRNKQDILETQKNADAFIAGTPAFIDNTANAHLLVNQARTMFGDGVITVPQFQSAYEYLRTRTDFLKLDQKELAKERKAADKARFDAEMAQRSAGPTEEELYSMPLDDLRRLDTIENHRRMRAEAERGGLGL